VAQPPIETVPDPAAADPPQEMASPTRPAGLPLMNTVPDSTMTAESGRHGLIRYLLGVLLLACQTFFTIPVSTLSLILLKVRA